MKRLEYDDENCVKRITRIFSDYTFLEEGIAPGEMQAKCISFSKSMHDPLQFIY